MSNSGNNPPQYKVGDIVNGHILTSQNEWKPVAVPPEASVPSASSPSATAEKPKRKWFARKRVLFPVGALALIIFVNAINQPDVEDVASTGASAEVEETVAENESLPEEQPAPEEQPVTEPSPEAPPAPEAGTASNPMPQPYVAEGLFGGEKYSLTGRVSADAPDVEQWNMFNDPAPAGFKWVVVEVTMTGIDTDGVEPSLASYDLSLSTPEGNQYSEDTGIVLGDGMPRMYEGPTLYPGSAFTGHMTFLVPTDSTGFMLHDNGNYIAL